MPLKNLTLVVPGAVEARRDALMLPGKQVCQHWCLKYTISRLAQLPGTVDPSFLGDRSLAGRVTFAGLVMNLVSFFFTQF